MAKVNNIPTSYNHALEMLNGQSAKLIKNKRGTRLEFFHTGVIAMTYHGTPVVHYFQNGEIGLYSGGYKTVTTKARMNSALGNKACVYQHKHQWYVHYFDGNVVQPFVEGMVV